jgi:uncharacterized protein YdcH (DUF465 family)
LWCNAIAGAQLVGRIILIRSAHKAGGSTAKDSRAMMRIPHQLQEEFPEEARFIKRLMKTDYEFRQLAAHYEEVNQNIFRIESEEEPTTDEVLERLKKQRLRLKDAIAAILAKLERRM